jgi:hypothetical protein
MTGQRQLGQVSYTASTPTTGCRTPGTAGNRPTVINRLYYGSVTCGSGIGAGDGRCPSQLDRLQDLRWRAPGERVPGTAVARLWPPVSHPVLHYDERGTAVLI